MAVLQGTAQNAQDFLNQLKGFLSNTTVFGTQPWQILRDRQTELIFKNTGLTGKDNIIIGFNLMYFNNQEDAGLKLSGFTQYLDWADWDNQRDALPLSVTKVLTPYVNDNIACLGMKICPYLPLSINPFSFWIVANTQRVIIIAKIGTYYESAYLGFINSYHDKGVYPYPLFMGGSKCGWAEEGVWNFKQSDTGDDHRSFINCFTRNKSLTSGEWMHFNKAEALLSPAALFTPQNKWLSVFNDCFQTGTADQYVRDARDSSSGYINGRGNTSIWPYCHTGLQYLSYNLDGSYPLFPCILSGPEGIYGELDGCMGIPGVGQSAENTIIQDGITYLVIPNVYRTGKLDYWALKLV